MELKIGECINDRYVVCDIRKYRKKKYALIIDKQEDAECFYEYKISEDGICNFSKVNDKELFRKLLIEFSNLENVLKGDLNGK